MAESIVCNIHRSAAGAAGCILSPARDPPMSMLEGFTGASRWPQHAKLRSSEYIKAEFRDEVLGGSGRQC